MILISRSENTTHSIFSAANFFRRKMIVMTNMKCIIPPACEPTVPLLGPYQIAGYAEKIGYKMEIYNFNNFFLQEIVNEHMSEDNILIDDELDKIEVLSYKKFLNSFEKIKNFEDLIKNDI